MEEFSGTTAQLDFGRSISLGSNPALPVRSNATTTPGLRYKNLGKSGLRVSNVGLGTWPIFSPGVSEEQAELILRLAVDNGINLFDLSEAHSGTRAELELGKIIRKTGWKRTSFIITTKIYWSTKSDERGLSRKHIIESVQASLQRLQLPYIDIILVHKVDSMCPMEEIVRAMNYVITQGWSMYWGTARWSPVEIMEAYTNCRQFNCVTPIVEQAEYHMFCREKAELYLPEMYNKIGVGFMAWGPLSMYLGDTHNGDRLWLPKGSFKTKSQSYSWTEDEVNKEDRMEETRRMYDKSRDISTLAEKLGCNAMQLSIAWSLKHEPVQCLLLGATSVDQLHQSLQALQSCPSEEHWIGLKRILRYLKGTISFRLLYHQDKDDVPLKGYADADFANDVEERRSNSGYAFTVYGNIVSWSSKRQQLVTLSSTEAELVSLCYASKEGVWMSGILREVGIQFVPFTIYEDNIPCIRIAGEPREHQRSKHIDIKYMYMKNLIKEKKMILEYIKSEEQIADLFTKPLHKTRFCKLVSSLGMIN
ncbi:voltage-gated potassium channel subunit beta-2 isoform X4 [Topomyia yanbarensis]|nr:voltage-gated potassium channel subunit beta-2 isoform X4 [Topomyia yanbarensis]XP_058830229.1 voltage-gated potassium channel subunit beta-2 isoform X4 [Topomyia yanbarensis]XP_058830230.1 voltage-gated potassium channel subunit beta-2 isoform X4 [Topomyia yanbarensis]XP_058830232.1 voltage-gated potassium channel subunit beta-2 isoform X4 [Topomyia yanbarensis]